MVVSMDNPGKHNGSVGHEADRYMSARYEHYLAEHEVDEAQEPAISPEADIVTPLASEKTTNDDASAIPDEHPSRSNTAEYEDKYKMRNASLRYAMPHSNSLSMEGYFGPYQPRSTPCSRRGMGPHPSSNPSSCGSLHGLSDREIHSATQSPVRRAVSTKSNPGHSRVRSTSHPKITSLSQPPSKRPSYSDQLVYPDQSLASLQASNITARPHPVLRTRSSHPAQNLLYNEISKANKTSTTSGFRTADNTPISSPGLFSPLMAKQPNANDNRPNTSQLHHLQTPKETHTAEIEHDVYSGNKFINSYEVVGELGRGEHGKVKLGRDIERHGHYVAIKIVPRYSAKRRLGKLGAPEDRTKREVAILKKARHPNVVSLLEVIDDPNKNKVYLILEYVDKGEIKWRKHGVKEILAVSNQRFEQEKLGINLGLESTERDTHIVHQAHVRHDRLENLKRYNQGLSHVPNWSLEYAGDTDDESDILDISRSISRQYSHVNSPIRGNSQDEFQSPSSEPPLSGSMYGSYMPEAYRHRKFSIANSAISHMSSEMNFDQDDDQRSYVPALTLEEARRAFRDTLLGLEFLHFIGIIHRDIKPANLLVSSSGAVKISDFGVSHLGSPITEEESERKTTTESDVAPLDDEKELARSVGTPAFWAPELCYETTDLFDDKKEPKITGALDLWALGITLYCMIYARLPFYHNQTIGIHEAVCTTEAFCPKTRLVPVDTTSPEPVSRPTHSINSNKRLDYELKFEHIPDTLRDLITKLLVKDPAHRITIAEAKKHPWVTEGLPDTEEFLQNPEMAKQSKKKILEISDKEIDRAVVKRSFVEKISNTAGRIVGSLLGRKDTRKRASTNVSSAGSSTDSLHSPAGSSTSTVGKGEKAREPRRPSLRGDELLQALKASRDPSEHHPLAQSQTASPDGKNSSQPTSPGYFDQYIKAASTGATPTVADHERQSRPKGPDRAVSALSTAESVKTIRASNYQRAPLSEFTSNPDLLHNELSLRTRVEGLWEGTTKTLTRLASRDRRRGTSGTRSGSRPKSENDGHAGPSLAVSNTHAAGAFQTPNVLRATEPEIEEPSTAPLSKEIDGRRSSPFRVPSSDHVVFEQAQQMNQRRQLQESLAKTDTIASMSSPDPEPNSCPPSPDDLLFNHSAPLSTQISPCDIPARVPSTQPQLSEVPISAITTAVSASSIATSLDDCGHSSVSQSNSNPSMGIISGSSSPPGEITMFGKHEDAFYENEYGYEVGSEGPASDIMSTADTATIHGRPTTPTALGKPLQEEQDYYDDGDDESESSDEEGIVMGGLRKG